MPGDEAFVAVKLPYFLEGKLAEEVYIRWVKNRADAHVKRDRLRNHVDAKRSAYRQLIHAAVVASKGRDFYTGEMLDWHLLGTYNNAESKLGRHAYKRGFGLLPSVDHLDAAATTAEIRICAWRTNDAKHDLTTTELIELSRRILEHHGWSLTPPAIAAQPCVIS